MSDFGLNPELDPAALKPLLAEAGRLHAPGILAPETAEAVAEALNAEREWTRAVTLKSGSFNVPLLDDQPKEAMHRRWLADAAVDPAEDAMQYIYDARPLSLDRQQGRPRGDLLDAFEVWLNGPEVIGFMRALTGEAQIAVTTAQASRFLPGHVLTAHNDRDAKKERLFAYVLNFSRPWFADYGGLLMFYDDGGHVTRAYNPAFNSLNLFKVPVTHAVSQVSTFAPGPRLAISGWFQSAPTPA
jgi:SM-20-related protein